jgi:hypothetical protein
MPRRGSRARDSNGRYISGFGVDRDASEIPLPRSDDDESDTARRIELVRRTEIARHVEPARRDETDTEMAGDTGDQDDIPRYRGPDGVRITTFEIEKADRNNIKNWKSQLQIFFETQDCWDIIELTYQHRKHPESIKALFDKGWKSANGRAKLYILKNIKPEDVTAIRDYPLSGEMWAYIVRKYERKTHVDVMYAIQKITTWKKDSSLDMESSLQQLEQLEAELKDVSNGKIQLGELMVLHFFLKGLPKEYETISYAIMGSETITRENVLSRLQIQEGILREQ